MTPEQYAKSGSEHAHQVALFMWAQQSGIAELKLMFAIPNGGLRDKRTATRLKAEGVKSGVPDIFLPVARKECWGLFIELKKPGGRVSEEQYEWIYELRKQGYGAAVCVGWEAARDVILQYLGGGK